MMIITNSLLAIGLSIAASFKSNIGLSNVIPPFSVSDFRRYVVGSPDSPLDLYLLHNSGIEFWIHDAVVYRYSTPGSLYQLQDPKQLPALRRPAVLSSNQVVAMAIHTLNGLAKGDRIVSGPIIRASDVTDLPFYTITWPSTNRGNSFMYAAMMEIDASKGQITFLDLRDPTFYDLKFARMISRDVCPSNLLETASPVTSTNGHRDVPIDRKLLPLPPRDQVSSAIKSWLWLCRSVAANPGDETNLDCVNWDRTFVYTSGTNRILQVRFKNGTCFEALGTTAFSHIASDACFTGFFMNRTKEDWAPFWREVVKKWEELAANLEHGLVKDIGFSKKIFQQYSPLPAYQEPKFGDYDMARVVIDWRDWPKEEGTYSVSRTKLAFSAEFDLNTGELKIINFVDPALIQILQTCQGPENSLGRKP